MAIDEVREALSWSLDLIDMYDERLAEIDGKELVYSPVHLRGKEKARKILSTLSQSIEQLKADYPDFL